MEQTTVIMQGDQYSITFGISFNDQPLDVSAVDTIQFVVGDIVQLYKADGSGNVQYDNSTGLFTFPVKQEQSFLLSGMQRCQARIKFSDASIVGGVAENIIFTFSSTKETI